MHVSAHDLDILQQADEVALRQLADSALLSYHAVFRNLNDQLVALSDKDTSDVCSSRSYDVMTGEEKARPPSTPPSSPNPKPIGEGKTLWPTPYKTAEKTLPALKGKGEALKTARPDTPTPISPPTPEEHQEARRKVNDKLLYKTSECTSWTPDFGCPCGKKCRFLHHWETPRPRPSQAQLEQEIKAEAWRLAELRQLPRFRPAHQYAVQKRRH